MKEDEKKKTCDRKDSAVISTLANALVIRQANKQIRERQHYNGACAFR